MIVNSERILDWRGRVIGRIDTDQDGNKWVKDFYGKVKGKYNKKANVTTDFYGRKIAKGDQCALLLNMN